MSNFKIVLTTILYKGMVNDDNETCTLNVDVNVDNIKYYVGNHTSLSLETLPYCQGMCLV
jgi:hypothetical protein